LNLGFSTELSASSDLAAGELLLATEEVVLDLDLVVEEVELIEID